jgi:hypothetical protein
LVSDSMLQKIRVSIVLSVSHFSIKALPSPLVDEELVDFLLQ